MSYEYEGHPTRVVRIIVASARGVASRWRAQYCHDGKWSFGDSKGIYSALVSLGPNPPIDKVVEIIGNKSWSHITCKGCGDAVERAVKIGDCFDPEITRCGPCLDEAARAIANPPPERKK